MFSAELKERTQQVHAELEKKLIIHIKSITTTAEYTRVLKMMYGFYFPLQNVLDPFLGEDQAGRGRQAGSILADIEYFSPGASRSLSLTEDLPQIVSYPSSLGALYVLEGSTLGGRIITGMITRQLGITREAGFSFFNAYGERTEAVWEDFKSMLNRPLPKTEKQAITNSAIATFRTFKNWINHYESATHQ